MTHLTTKAWDEYLSRRQRGSPAALLTPKLAEERPKYRNKKVWIDGRKFDSKAEGARYVVLKHLQGEGAISGLKCQVPYRLVVNGELICKYVADFVYFDSDMKQVVEDVKGPKTRDYQIKKKLMQACHHIHIVEISKERRRAKKS